MLAVGLAAVATSDRLALHAAINCCHAHVLDRFFAAFTHLADGLVPALLALIILVTRDLRSFLMMGLSSGLSAIITQSLKRGPFAHEGRPSTHREALGAMDWVEGIDLHVATTFPSGHSTAAFSMCLALAVVLGRRHWAIPLAIVAGLLAFSRVYLSQHFTEDIIAGSLIGTLTAVAVHHWLYRTRFADSPWLNRRVLRAG